MDDVDELNEKLMNWLVWYNTKRYHWSLDLTSPVDYLINNGLLSKMSWTNTRLIPFVITIKLKALIK